MKRYFSIIVCALLLVTSANAQYDGLRKPVNFGFDLGLGYANQWGNAQDAYAKNGIFSFLFGIDLDINFGDKSFIEVGIDLTRKGCRYESTKWTALGGPWNLYDGDKTTCNLYYLQVPVMYGIELPIENEIAWKFMVGPYFGIGATGDRRTSYKNDRWKVEELLAKRDPETIASFSKDYQYGFRRFDVGARVQTGVQVRRVSYMIAYEIGLFNILRDDKYDDMKSHNNGIMGIVSFRF